MVAYDIIILSLIAPSAMQINASITMSLDVLYRVLVHVFMDFGR